MHLITYVPKQTATSTYAYILSPPSLQVPPLSSPPRPAPLSPDEDDAAAGINGRGGSHASALHLTTLPPAVPMTTECWSPNAAIAAWKTAVVAF